MQYFQVYFEQMQLVLLPKKIVLIQPENLRFELIEIPENAWQIKVRFDAYNFV